MRLRATVLAAALAAGAAPAWACAPPVKLPHADEREHQEWMWENAQSVVVVRLVAFLKPDPSLSVKELRQQRLNGLPAVRVTLEAVQWLKGKRPQAAFGMPAGGTGDCIPTSGWDSVSAKVGDTFVAYFRPGTLSGETLMGGVVPADIVAPDLKASLTAQ